jgi:hypothetical protein
MSISQLTDDALLMADNDLSLHVQAAAAIDNTRPTAFTHFLTYHTVALE